MNQPTAAHEAIFRVGPLVNLASLVQSLGCDPGPVFRQSGFGLEEFQDPDHWLPYLRSSRLLENCVRATACDQIGLLLGQRAEPSHLGMAGFLVSTAPKVEQALQAFVENLDLHDEGGTATLDVGPDYTSLGFSLHLPGISAVEQIGDLSAVMMYKVMRTLCGADWVASTIKLITSNLVASQSTATEEFSMVSERATRSYQDMVDVRLIRALVGRSKTAYFFDGAQMKLQPDPDGRIAKQN